MKLVKTETVKVSANEMHALELVRGMLGNIATHGSHPELVVEAAEIHNALDSFIYCWVENDEDEM